MVHGMMDDNVHPSNTFQMAHVLQSADIPFEMQFYPNKTHGLHGSAASSAKWSFLTRHLVGP